MADEKDRDKPYAATYEPPSLGVNPSYGEPDEYGFVGVSQEYSNYANSTDEPLEGDPVEEKKSAPERESWQGVSSPMVGQGPTVEGGKQKPPAKAASQESQK